jgi:peptidylprolyl isomerase
MIPVFRPARRVLPFLLVGALGLGLASCGDDEGSSTASSAGFDDVSVTGEVGKSIDVKFDSQVSVNEVSTKVLTEGDGPEVADGDQVTTHLYLGNGFTQEEALNTYDSGSPERLTVDENQLSEVFIDALSGHTVGSRQPPARHRQQGHDPGGGRPDRDLRAPGGHRRARVEDA